MLPVLVLPVATMVHDVLFSHCGMVLKMEASYGVCSRGA